MSRARRRLVIVLAVLIVMSAAVFVVSVLLKDDTVKDKGRVVNLAEDPELTEGERINITIDPKNLVEANGNLYFARYNYTADNEGVGLYSVYPITGYREKTVSSTDADGTGSVIVATVTATNDNDRGSIVRAQTTLTTNALKTMTEIYRSGEYVDLGYDEAKVQKAIEVLTRRSSAEGIETLRQNISPYTLEVVKTNAVTFEIMKTASAAAAALCIVVLIYALLGIKIRARFLVLGTVLLIICTIGVVAFILRHDISTMISLKEFCPGLTMARIVNGYKLDNMMQSQPKTESEMLNAISEELLYGVPISVDLSSFGCSAFSAKTADGTHLFGRNFDLGDTDGTIIYTAPEDGYKSIGVCDLSVINLAGKNRFTEVTSLTGRALARVFPYITFDGMNEKGLGIGILSLDYKPSHPDTDKPDTYMLLAIRYILDRCATVDEAVDFLKSYDVHSMAVYNYHLFITDKSGRSVIAEWVDNELYIIEGDHVCNSYMTNQEEVVADARYQTLDKRLSECGGVMTASDAMDLLKAVKQKYNDADTATQWSCVYDLDNFKLYIVSDMDFDNVYEVVPDSFG